MAKSFKELGKKAENLIEQGREADQRLQTCQARVSAASSRVAAARSQLAAASETDEEGRPKGNVEQALAQLRVAEGQLAASQRALADARGTVGRIKQEKTAHVREIEQHNKIERSNLEKLRQLRAGAFGENAAAISEGIAQRLNEAEDAKAALLRSMGMEAAPDYVTVGEGGGSTPAWVGSFAFTDTSGRAEQYQGGGVAAPVGGGLGSGPDPYAAAAFGAAGAATPGASANPTGSTIGAQSPGAQSGASAQNGNAAEQALLARYQDEINRIIADPNLSGTEKKQMLNAARAQLLAMAEVRAKRTEADAIKQNCKVLRLSETQKREMGTRYIENMMDVYRENLKDHGVSDGPEMQQLLNVLQDHYRAELEKDIAGQPNRLYEDPNYETISKLGIPFVMGMHSTLQGSPHKDVQNLYAAYANKLTVLDTTYTGTAHYSSATGGVYFNAKEAASGDGMLDKPYQVAFHEFGHNIDFLMGGGSPISESWGNNALYAAICEDYKALKGNRTEQQLVADLRQACKDNNWSYYDVGSVSDILECMTGVNYPLGAGHGSELVSVRQPDGSIVKQQVRYWHNRLPNKEFFAETLDGAAANSQSYRMMKMFFPRAVNVVHQIIGGVK